MSTKVLFPFFLFSLLTTFSFQINALEEAVEDFSILENVSDITQDNINWEDCLRAQQQKLLNSNPSLYLSEEVWKEVQDFLIPNDLPIKEKLDQIFLSSRTIKDPNSMRDAGFTFLQLKNSTKIVVAKHPALSGYVIKAYLDSIEKNLPEHWYLIQRIKGCRLVEDSIRRHHYQHLLKSPKKWLYLLPDDPSPPPQYNRKMFILVEEDMDIFNENKNEKLWKSKKVTKELIRALHTVMTEVGLADIKPGNCPFSKDGRIAFIDTGKFDKEAKPYKLDPYLSPPMRNFWLRLNNTQ